MTWTTPQHVSSGTASSSQFNDEVADNLQHLYDETLQKEIGCRLTRGSFKSIANSTVTAVDWDGERFDDDTMHSTSSNTTRITFTTAGTYAIGGVGRFATNATGKRQVNIRLNGATVIAASSCNAVSGSPTFVSVSSVWRFSAADYIEFEVEQNSGGALNLETGNGHCEFFAYRLGT